MRWNEAKYRVFKIMQARRESDIREPITAYRLALLTGVDVESLLSLLPRWVEWRYISRLKLKGNKRIIKFNGRSLHIACSYHYLKYKGKMWVQWFELFHSTLANDYFEKLQAHITSIQPKKVVPVFKGATYIGV